MNAYIFNYKIHVRDNMLCIILYIKQQDSINLTEIRFFSSCQFFFSSCLFYPKFLYRVTDEKLVMLYLAYFLSDLNK
jgi:hypothetical protein